MAARTGRPIVYGVASAKPALLLSSWDRFVIPAPLARIHIAYGRMEAPEDDAPQTIAAAREALQDAMRALSCRLSDSTPR